MSLIGKSLTLTLTLAGLASGISSSVAAQNNSQAQPVEVAGPIQCIVEKRRGRRVGPELPARVPVYWREMPMSVTCGTPTKNGVEQTIRMPRDRWLPVTFLIDDIVIAHLDPKAGYRFRKPARMTLSLHPRVFASRADQERWYKKRLDQIEKAYLARQTDLENKGVDCKFDATCLDEIEDLVEAKKSWVQKLNRLRAKTSILPPGAVIRKPASVEIQDRDGKLCLTKQADGTWRSRPCKNALPEIRRIVVGGKEECIARIDADTWESRPCP